MKTFSSTKLIPPNTTKRVSPSTVMAVAACPAKAGTTPSPNLSFPWPVAWTVTHDDTPPPPLEDEDELAPALSPTGALVTVGTVAAWRSAYSSPVRSAPPKTHNVVELEKDVDEEEEDEKECSEDGAALTAVTVDPPRPFTEGGTNRVTYAAMVTESARPQNVLLIISK